MPQEVITTTFRRSNIFVLFCKTRLIFIVYLYLNQSFPEINKNKIRHQCEHLFKKKKRMFNRCPNCFHRSVNDWFNISVDRTLNWELARAEERMTSRGCARAGRTIARGQFGLVKAAGPASLTDRTRYCSDLCRNVTSSSMCDGERHTPFPRLNLCYRGAGTAGTHSQATRSGRGSG